MEFTAKLVQTMLVTIGVVGCGRGGDGAKRDGSEVRRSDAGPRLDYRQPITRSAESWPALRRASVHVAVDKHHTVGVVLTGDLVESGKAFGTALEAAPADAPGIAVFRAWAVGTTHSWTRVAETQLTVHSLFVSVDDLVLGAEVHGPWRWRDHPDRPGTTRGGGAGFLVLEPRERAKWYVGRGPRALEIGIDRGSDRTLKAPEVSDGGALVVDGRLQYFVLAGLPDHPRVAVDGIGGPWPDQLPTPLLNASGLGNGLSLCAWRASHRRDARSKRPDVRGESFVERRDTDGHLLSTATLQPDVRRDQACKVFAAIHGGVVVPGPDGRGLVLVGRDSTRTLHEGPSSPRLIASDLEDQVAMVAALDDRDDATTLTVLDTRKDTPRLSLALPPGLTIQSVALAGDILVVGGHHRGTITMDGNPSLSLPTTSDEPTPFYWIIRLGSR